MTSSLTLFVITATAPCFLVVATVNQRMIQTCRSQPRQYPGLSRAAQPNAKRFTVRRIVGAGNLWVTEFILAYDGRPSYSGSVNGVPGWQGCPRDPILCRPVRSRTLARASG
jgi:hypothetical protein